MVCLQNGVIRSMGTIQRSTVCVCVDVCVGVRSVPFTSTNLEDYDSKISFVLWFSGQVCFLHNYSLLCPLYYGKNSIT